jgi:hypothetical protein
METKTEKENKARKWFRGLTLPDLVTVAVFAAIPRVLDLASKPISAGLFPWSEIYFTVTFFIPAFIVASIVRKPGVLTLWALSQYLIGVILFGLHPVWIVSNLPFGLSGDLILYFTNYYTTPKIWKTALAGFIMAWVESTWILWLGILYGEWLPTDYYLSYVCVDSIFGLLSGVVGQRLGQSLQKLIH